MLEITWICLYHFSASVRERNRQTDRQRKRRNAYIIQWTLTYNSAGKQPVNCLECHYDKFSRREEDSIIRVKSLQRCQMRTHQSGVWTSVAREMLNSKNTAMKRQVLLTQHMSLERHMERDVKRIKLACLCGVRILRAPVHSCGAVCKSVLLSVLACVGVLY